MCKNSHAMLMHTQVVKNESEELFPCLVTYAQAYRRAATPIGTGTGISANTNTAGAGAGAGAEAKGEAEAEGWATEYF